MKSINYESHFRRSGNNGIQFKQSTYVKVHGPVPALQHHLSKMHLFMLLQPDPSAITVLSKQYRQP